MLTKEQVWLRGVTTGDRVYLKRGRRKPWRCRHGRVVFNDHVAMFVAWDHGPTQLVGARHLRLLQPHEERRKVRS